MERQTHCRVGLLFSLILLGPLPFLIGGVRLSGLGKLSPSSPLLPLYSRFYAGGLYPQPIFFMVRGCSPGPLVKSSAGEVLRSRAYRSAMAPSRQVFLTKQPAPDYTDIWTSEILGGDLPTNDTRLRLACTIPPAAKSRGAR
jgi:hypothetical protein